MAEAISTADGLDGDFAAATEAAQQMVAACVVGDPELAGRIAGSFAHGDPATAVVLALVVAELAAQVHGWWARAVFPDWPGEHVVEAWEHVTRQLEAQADGG